MSTLTKTPIVEDLLYPESDGQPMAENTKQYEWIVTIKENLDALLVNAFVAADLFWYPVKGKPKIVYAPDVMVAQGRPKGHRGSYKQWEEGNIAPQVVFEILSPGNTPIEMAQKQAFYGRYGVEEFYIYDPDREALAGFTRQADSLEFIEEMSGWVSPLLNIRFELSTTGLNLYLPNGQPFITFQQLLARVDAETQRADAESQRANAESQRADAETQRAEQERQDKEVALQKLAQLEEKLRQLGIDSDGGLTKI